MSPKAPSSPPAATPAWSILTTVGLLGMVVGATFMYFALRSRPANGVAPMAGPATTPAANPDPATHLPDPALTAGQSPAQAERTLGNFYYDHQNWPQAIQRYEAAIRQGSDDADIRTDLGNAYRFSGRPDDALAQYSVAQRTNPNHEFSLFNQGGLYLEELKQPARAVEIWQEYLARFPRGQNVEAARQLIARAQGGAASVPPAPLTSTAPSAPGNSTEDLILRQIQTAKPKTGSP